MMTERITDFRNHHQSWRGAHRTNDRRLRAREPAGAVCATKLGTLILSAVLGVFAVLLVGCSRRSQGADSGSPASLPDDFPSGKPFFARVPPPADWRHMTKAPPSLDKANRWGPLFDLRHVDLSRLDLTGRTTDLLRSFFDTGTIWPAALPPGFDPAKILELNRSPGLGIRTLHRLGITGKGVSVAVVDTPFLLDHEEYAERLRFYGEVNAWDVPANFHGTLTTSILAGRTCGVAPEAEIYYIGSHNYDLSSVDDSHLPNAGHIARAVDLLLEVSDRLPREKKLRVISVSAGWGRDDLGFRAMNKAVRKAAEKGVFVVSSNVFDGSAYDFWYWGLDRSSTDNPEDPDAYRVVPWKDWISQVGGKGSDFPEFYERKLARANPPEFLLLPEGSKTVAHPHGRSEYGFYPMGGWSSLSPYIGGLYALACQVRPEITPESFWAAALATGDRMPVVKDGKTYAGKRVNPVRLLESLR